MTGTPDRAAVPRHGRSAALRLAFALVALKLAAHAVAQLVSPYEFHRDEFLYLAMGDHLRLWGMDFPPFIALAANLQRAVFGDHLWAVRVLPALAGAALVWLTVDTAWRLGGGRLAQFAAGISILLAPLVLRVSVLFQPVVFDQLWWTLALWTVIRRGQDEDPRWWLGTGAALGLGLLTKFSIAFVAIPLALAVLATGLRRDLATRWPWLALGICLLLGHPSLAGQIALGWPFFGQMAGLRASQLEHVTYAAFLGEQLFMLGPAALLAIVGAVRLIGWPRHTAERTAGLAAAGAFLFLMVMHGKAYYAGPVFPLLIAAGAAGIAAARTRAGAGSRPAGVEASEARAAAPRGAGRAIADRAGRWALGVLTVAQLAYGGVSLPMGLPVLPPEPMARYAARLGVSGATRTNTGVQLDLPQDYADMLGWAEFADTVARVFNELPEADRARASLLATNYGRAGALDHYGRSRGLPPAVSLVGSYWFWGPGDRSWEVAVIAGADSASLSAFFREFELGARIVDPWRVPEERDVPVWVVRGPIEPMADVWERFGGRN